MFNFCSGFLLFRVLSFLRVSWGVLVVSWFFFPSFSVPLCSAILVFEMLMHDYSSWPSRPS